MTDYSGEVCCALCGQPSSGRGQAGFGGFFLRGKYVCARCEGNILRMHSGLVHYNWLVKEIRQMLVV